MKSLVDQLETQGFRIVPKVLCDAQTATLSDAIDHAMQRQSTLMTEAESKRGVYALRNVLQIAEVRGVAQSGPVADMMRELLGPQARVVRGIVFDKTPQANWKVPWHQDLTIAVQQRHDISGFGPWSIKDGVPHVQPPMSILQTMLTIRLHLDNCDSSNGPLRVLPATHQLGRLDAESIVSQRQMKDEVLCCVPRGGALLMKPLLLHASSACQNPSRRRVLHLEWATHDLPVPLLWNEES